MFYISGGSRISRRGGLDPLGGMDPQCGGFLAKMCVKTKELGPVGGRVPGTPPRSANVHDNVKNEMHREISGIILTKCLETHSQ